MALKMALKTILVGLIIACALLSPFVSAENETISSNETLVTTIPTTIPTTVATPIPTPEPPHFITPTMTANLASSTIIRGDPITISGTTTGNLSRIAVWILGNNQGNRFETSPNTDGRFTLTLENAMTNLYSDGTYFVIIQHPGNNGEFDTALDNSKGYTKNGQDKKYVINFNIPYTTGSLRGEDAEWTVMNSIKSGDDLTKEFTLSITTPTKAPTPTPTASPTQTTITTTQTPVPTQTPLPTTIVTTLPTTQPIETVTANPTEAPQMRITVAPVIQEKSLVEPSESKTVDQKLDEINQKVDNQQIQLDNQQSILDQIMTFLKSIFNWT